VRPKTTSPTKGIPRGRSNEEGAAGEGCPTAWAGLEVDSVWCQQNVLRGFGANRQKPLKMQANQGPGFEGPKPEACLHLFQAVRDILHKTLVFLWPMWCLVRVDCVQSSATPPSLWGSFSREPYASLYSSLYRSSKAPQPSSVPKKIPAAHRSCNPILKTPHCPRSSSGREDAAWFAASPAIFGRGGLSLDTRGPQSVMPVSHLDQWLARPHPPKGVPVSLAASPAGLFWARPTGLNCQCAISRTTPSSCDPANPKWSGPRPGGLTLRLRDSWGTEVRGWSSLVPRVGRRGAA
jgi:hypothetical protein